MQCSAYDCLINHRFINQRFYTIWTINWRSLFSNALFQRVLQLSAARLPVSVLLCEADLWHESWAQPLEGFLALTYTDVCFGHLLKQLMLLVTSVSQPAVSSEESYKDTAADTSSPCHWCLAHIFVCVHTLLFILPLRNRLTQMPLMSTPITHTHTHTHTQTHTEGEEYIGDKRTRGENEGDRWLMAGGGFFWKAGCVLSLRDKTVWGGGDTTHSHSCTSANRSVLSGWLPA